MAASLAAALLGLAAALLVLDSLPTARPGALPCVPGTCQPQQAALWLPRQATHEVAARPCPSLHPRWLLRGLHPLTLRCPTRHEVAVGCEHSWSQPASLPVGRTLLFVNQLRVDMTLPLVSQLLLDTALLLVNQLPTCTVLHVASQRKPSKAGLWRRSMAHTATALEAWRPTAFCSVAWPVAWPVEASYSESGLAYAGLLASQAAAQTAVLARRHFSHFLLQTCQDQGPARHHSVGDAADAPQRRQQRTPRRQQGRCL